MGSDLHQLRDPDDRSALSGDAEGGPRAPSLLFALVALAVIVLDQVTKSIALAKLDASPRHVLGPFGLELTYNTGSSFSLLQGATPLLVVVDVVVIGFLAVLGARASRRLTQVGLGLMLGGALGNLADRFVRHHHGAVVDFVTLSHWPTFNLADASLTLGTILVIASLLSDRSRRRGEEPA